MTSQHNVSLIRMLQKSWSGPDPDAFSSLFTDDGIFQDIPYAIHLQGHEQLRAYSARMKKHSRDLQVHISHCDATDVTGVAEWTLTHLFSGCFDGVECTDKPVKIAGLSKYQFAGGRIARAVDYWNYMDIVRAVQVVPREMLGMRSAPD